MRKVLVIFHSFTGTSRRVAHLLASGQGWAVGEVVEDRARPQARSMWECVADSLLRRRPPVLYDGPPPEDFDLVVLVGPVWLHRLGGPMRSFVAANASRLRAYAVVSTMRSSGSGGAEAELRHLTRRPPVLCAEIAARHVEDGTFGATLDVIGDTLAGRETVPWMGQAAVPARAA